MEQTSIRPRHERPKWFQVAHHRNCNLRPPDPGSNSISPGSTVTRPRRSCRPATRSLAPTPPPTPPCPRIKPHFSRLDRDAPQAELPAGNPLHRAETPLLSLDAVLH